MSSGPTKVNRRQRRSNEVNDLCRLFGVLLPSRVIWSADFNADIHFALRRLEMSSWKQQVIKGQWRHMTRRWFFFEFLTPSNYPRHSKNIVTCFTRRKEHAGRWNFALAPSEAKLSAITGFGHFSALDLTSEVTGWSRIISLYINLFVSRRATCSFFFREALAQSGAKRQGGRTPLVPWKDAKWPLPARVETVGTKVPYVSRPFFPLFSACLINFIFPALQICIIC